MSIRTKKAFDAMVARLVAKGFDEATATLTARQAFPRCAASATSDLATTFQNRIDRAVAKGRDRRAATMTLAGRFASEYRNWLDTRNTVVPAPDPGSIDEGADAFDKLVERSRKHAMSLHTPWERRAAQQAVARSHPREFECWNARNSGASIPSASGSRFPAA